MTDLTAIPAQFPAAPACQTLGDIRAAIVSGQLTARAAVAASRARVAALDGGVKAFIRDVPAPEKTAAREADLPLAGCALGVKDLYNTKGVISSYGSEIYKENIPDADATLVGQLKALGAEVIGKTVTTEFAWRQAGPTVNPWNFAHTPGGSSSGSAAAVAAGFVPLALGTQTFGSVIRPASFCGVVGFKPSHGGLSLAGVQPLAPTLDHAGFFARDLGDITYSYACLTQKAALTPRDVGPLRIRLLSNGFERQASPKQAEVLAAAAAKLAALGHHVEARELPAPFECALTLAEDLLAIEAAQIYGPLLADHPDLLSMHIRALVETGRALAPGRLVEVLAARAQLQADYQHEMAGFDLILTLPALGEAPLQRDGTGNPGPCVLWTLLGLPCLALPQVLGAQGLPVGLQLVGKAGGDMELLAQGAEISRALPRDFAYPA